MLTFPRAMPEAGAMQHGFEPQRVDYLSPETGARIGSITAGWPLWRLTVNLNAMVEADADVWRAWLQAQRGSQRRFYGYDLSRAVPRFHRGGIPYTSSPSGWSQTIGDDGTAVLTLTGCMPGMILLPVDYVGFRWGTFQRSLVRVIGGGGTADANGNLVVMVEPAVHAATPAGATVNLTKADCLMRLVTAETQLGDQMYGGGYTAAGGKITAIQDIVA